MFQLTANAAFSALVNLSAGDMEVCKIMNDDSFVKPLINMLVSSKAVLADAACMLLANLTKYEPLALKLLSMTVDPIQGLSESDRAMDVLVDVFVVGLRETYKAD